MNILLSCASFKEYTGSEIYFFELAEALNAAGHNVYIYSPNIGLPLLSDLSTDIIAIDTIHTLKTISIDIVIFSHGVVTWPFISSLKCNKLINVVHSEVISAEQPIVRDNIHYVSIRPAIADYILKEFGIISTVIYNPFNFDRFNRGVSKKCVDSKNDRIVLFPGSLDYLRIKPVMQLLRMARDQKFKLIHVGRNDYNITDDNFISYPSTKNIEQFYAKCDIVTGIFLGRTSIEGLLCGKKVYQFDVDNKGNILRHYWYSEDDLSKFDRNTVAKRIIEV